MVRFKNFHENYDKSYFIFGAIMIIIFLIIAILFLEIPYYFPNYSYVSHIYQHNLKYIELPPERGINIVNITVNDYNNTLIAFTENSGNVNITVLNMNGEIIANNQQYVGTKLPSGYYRIFLINMENISKNVTFTYGIFNYQSIASFYSSLGLLKSVYEILMAGSLVIGLYSIIKGVARTKRLKWVWKLRKR
ncbi:MAG: hypothetical protein QXV70_06850 [Saccharolobus sp.]